MQSDADVVYHVMLLVGSGMLRTWSVYLNFLTLPLQYTLKSRDANKQIDKVMENIQ